MDASSTLKSIFSGCISTGMAFIRSAFILISFQSHYIIIATLLQFNSIFVVSIWMLSRMICYWLNMV